MMPAWIAGILACGNAWGQGLEIAGPRVRDYANGVLALMSYSAVPDLASSSLSIE